MDANNKGRFILSMVNGLEVPCPHCGTRNAPTNKICSSCGASLSQDEPTGAAAFTPKEAVPTKTEPVEEPKSAFAKGLPDWDLLPPQILVRRR